MLIFSVSYFFIFILFSSVTFVYSIFIAYIFSFDVLSINDFNATPKNGIYPLSTAKNTGISLFS